MINLPLPDIPCSYTAEQMLAYADAAREQALEDAAALCEENVTSYGNADEVLVKHRGPLSHEGQRYAVAIRALKDKP